MAGNARLTSMQLALRYGVSTKLLDQWKAYAEFPRHAAVRDGNRLLWDHRLTDEWLRNRRLGHTGRKPVWLHVVNHPEANAIERVHQHEGLIIATE